MQSSELLVAQCVKKKNCLFNLETSSSDAQTQTAASEERGAEAASGSGSDGVKPYCK